MGGNDYQPSQRQAVVEAIVGGMTYPQASRHYRVPMTTCWRWVMVDTDRSIIRQTKLDRDTIAEIQLSIDSGEPLRAIGRRLGIHHRTVSKYRDQMTVGGMAPRAHRCGQCGAKITTRQCLRCER